MTIKLLSTIDSSYQAPLEVLAYSLLQSKHDWTTIEKSAISYLDTAVPGAVHRCAN